MQVSTSLSKHSQSDVLTGRVLYQFHLLASEGNWDVEALFWKASHASKAIVLLA